MRMRLSHVPVQTKIELESAEPAVISFCCVSVYFLLRRLHYCNVYGRNSRIILCEHFGLLTHNIQEHWTWLCSMYIQLFNFIFSTFIFLWRCFFRPNSFTNILRCTYIRNTIYKHSSFQRKHAKLYAMILFSSSDSFSYTF